MDGRLIIQRGCEPHNYDTKYEPNDVLFRGYIKNDKIVSKEEYYYKEQKPVVHEVPKRTRVNSVRLFYEYRKVNRNVEASELLTDDCIVCSALGIDLQTKVKVLEFWEARRNDPQPDLTMEDPVEVREQDLIYRIVSMKKFFLTIAMKMEFWFTEDGKIKMIKVSKA